MNITAMREDPKWLLLVFTLPASKASERVQMWRKIQRFGAIPFRNAGSLLPNTADNRERFEWLARAIRASHGEASVLQIQAIDDLPSRALQDQFREARADDYTALIEDLQKLKPAAPGPSTQILRLRRRFEEIVAIDFFTSPLRERAEEALARAEQRGTRRNLRDRGSASKAEYQKRTWITRPRPGIDRVSSAWLISRFIDAKPKFIFDTSPATHRNAIPFDMFQGAGFGHEGDQCTFETLCLAFDISDHKALTIGQAVHDADLEDGKFGRQEGHTINQILRGWAAQGVPDNDLLRRGMDLIEGFYHSISKTGESLQVE
jgi:hypothetical protein